MSEEKKSLNRRQFLGTTAAVGALGVAGISALTSCSQKSVELDLPPLLDEAPDGELLKAGLIGCGGRGKGAAVNFLKAGPNIELVALADVFQDRLDNCREMLKNGVKLSKEKTINVEIPDENCFVGFDAYKKLIDSDVDIVLIATPPKFRPEHFAACVDARKHVFMEKPMAVDPVGARSIMATAKKAETAGLTVVTGTQRRHERNYVETYKKVANGAIGEIVSANAYWIGTQPWYVTHKAGWSDMEYMVRNWVNWNWLSGDHIVEQHVHNLDVILWFSGKKPVSAVGFGGRHRRKTGDQFDHFSIDFTYENGMHMQSMCRQIHGCKNNVSEFITGSKGFTNCVDKIWDLDGKLVWEYPYEVDEDGEKIGVKNAYDQEHVDMITAIRTNKPINEAENTATATMMAIMGRITAYTGQEVTWEEMMKSSLTEGPSEYAFGPVDIPEIPATPGMDMDEYKEMKKKS